MRSRFQSLVACPMFTGAPVRTVAHAYGSDLIDPWIALNCCSERISGKIFAGGIRKSAPKETNICAISAACSGVHCL